MMPARVDGAPALLLHAAPRPPPALVAAAVQLDGPRPERGPRGATAADVGEASGPHSTFLFWAVVAVAGAIVLQPAVGEPNAMHGSLKGTMAALELAIGPIVDAVVRWWPHAAIVLAVAHLSSRVPDERFQEYAVILAKSDMFGAAALALLGHYVVMVEQPEPLLENLAIRLGLAVLVLSLARQMATGVRFRGGPSIRRTSAAK